MRYVRQERERERFGRREYIWGIVKNACIAGRDFFSLRRVAMYIIQLISWCPSKVYKMHFVDYYCCGCCPMGNVIFQFHHPSPCPNVAFESGRTSNSRFCCKSIQHLP